jgi:CAAX protease family protein
MDREDLETEQHSETEEVHREPHLTILQAFGLVILLLILQLIISRIFVFAKDPRLADTHWISIALTHLFSGVVTAQAGAILAGFSLIALLMSVRFQYLLLLPLAVALCGLTILASEFGNILHWISPIPRDYTEFIDQLFGQNFWGVLITIGLIAPIVEELLFRGVILEGLQIRYNTKTAVIVSSLLFGITHVIPWAIINAFLLGFFFAWLKLKTGSLRLCIAAHALYNSLPFVINRVMVLNIPGFNNTPTEPVQFQPYWFDALGLFLFLLGIGGLRALYEPEPAPPLPEPS